MRELCALTPAAGEPSELLTTVGALLREAGQQPVIDRQPGDGGVRDATPALGSSAGQRHDRSSGSTGPSAVPSAPQQSLRWTVPVQVRLVQPR